MTEDKKVFPSPEWIEKYVELLNSNPAYKEAAKTWEGDFIFQIDPDGVIVKEPIRFYLDLWHGDCREGRMATEDDDAEFLYQGTYENWKKLLNGEIDPIRGIMSRKFKLKGSMSKVMRATKAASELVATAARVPTKFIDE
ncbi:MAG: hypothetical protein BAJATHORv1_70090 [Candidatus Thorarchaeota archaeon]|nr:MAG: hypothetical protein BAJATHORv1_70090 [Candidatus Thorarchaeota archaeon]